MVIENGLLVEKKMDTENQRVLWVEKYKGFESVNALTGELEMVGFDRKLWDVKKMLERYEVGKVVVQAEKIIRIALEYVVDDARFQQKVQGGSFFWQDRYEATYLVTLTIKVLDPSYMENVEAWYDNAIEISDVLDDARRWASGLADYVKAKEESEKDMFIKENPEKYDEAVEKAKGKKLGREQARLV